jgi:hypothetical protein
MVKGTYTLIAAWLVAGLGATLASCGGDAPTEAVATPASAPAAGIPGGEYTAAVPLGAAAASAKLAFKLGAVPRVGEPLTIDLRLITTKPVQKVQVVLEPEEGLALVDEVASNFALGASTSGAEHMHKVQVLAAREGVLLLRATVVTDTEAGSRPTDFAVPLIVGAAAAAPAAPAPAAAPAEGG